LRPTLSTPALPITVLKSHDRAVNALHIIRPDPSSSSSDPSSVRIVSASRDMAVKLWSPTSKSPIGNFLGHTLSVMAVGAPESGTIIASGARDYNVKIWDTNTCQCTSTAKVSRNLVTCLKFWKDGSYKFAQGSEDLTMRVWDVRFITNNSTNASCALTFGKYLYFPLDVDVSKCGHYVASSSKGFDGSGCEGRVWDVRKPEVPVHVLDGHTQVRAS